MARRRNLVAVLFAGFLVFVAASPAGAHPLGNFTINQYVGIYQGPGRGTLDYVVDRAEIPTQQLRDRVDQNSNGHFSRSELTAFASSDCAALQPGLELAIGGRNAPLTLASHGALALKGQAGLPTVRLECRYTWRDAARADEVRFANRNFGDRIGWREITVTGDRALVRGRHLTDHSVSNRLTAYPKGQLHSPRDQRTVAYSYIAGGPAAALPGRAATPAEHANPLTDWLQGVSDYLGRLVEARDLSLGLALVAMAMAMALGALHAIAPGHGKTVMAAYLVGERGSVRHGLVLGLTVAVTHTAGVLVLGAVLTASETIAPESILPWLGIASGLCFAALGISLFFRARRARHRGGLLRAHAHHHHRAHGHDHDHDHGHDHGHDHADAPATLGTRGLITLGFAGGLVPTPSALIVLLGATAIGRAWFGVVLVVAYGLGMAATLVGAGLALAWARRRFELKHASQRALRIAAALPIVTATVVTGGGLLLIGRAFAAV